MRIFKTLILPVILATVWIGISEFARNEFLLKSYWTNHYESLGLVFPSEPLNGAIWGLWSLFFAVLIYIISRKFGMLHTVMISWFAGFVLMWTVVWNMGVFPLEILLYAIPLSILEVYIASLIIFRISFQKSN